jgi:L-lactate dehydrogenase
LRNGQVHDLSDVAYATGGGMRVRAATHHEAGQCDIVVITAGSKYGLGKTLDSKKKKRGLGLFLFVQPRDSF